MQTLQAERYYIRTADVYSELALNDSLILECMTQALTRADLAYSWVGERASVSKGYFEASSGAEWISDPLNCVLYITNEVRRCKLYENIEDNLRFPDVRARWPAIIPTHFATLKWTIR